MALNIDIQKNRCAKTRHNESTSILTFENSIDNVYLAFDSKNFNKLFYSTQVQRFLKR